MQAPQLSFCRRLEFARQRNVAAMQVGFRTCSSLTPGVSVPCSCAWCPYSPTRLRMLPPLGRQKALLAAWLCSPAPCAGAAVQDCKAVARMLQPAVQLHALQHEQLCCYLKWGFHVACSLWPVQSRHLLSAYPKCMQRLGSCEAS